MPPARADVLDATPHRPAISYAPAGPEPLYHLWAGLAHGANCWQTVCPTITFGTNGEPTPTCIRQSGGNGNDESVEQWHRYAAYLRVAQQL